MGACGKGAAGGGAGGGGSGGGGSGVRGGAQGLAAGQPQAGAGPGAEAEEQLAAKVAEALHLLQQLLLEGKPAGGWQMAYLKTLRAAVQQRLKYR